MKIGIFSDLHLGKRQYGLEERENDFYNQYDSAIDTFINNNVNAVICAGDLFDIPRPSPKTLGRFVQGLNKLFDSKIPFINVIGNHSMIQSPNFVTADKLIDDIVNTDLYILLDKEKQYDKNDVHICGLPYFFNYEIDEFKKSVYDLNNSMSDKNGYRILVLHQSFKEYCGFSGEELSIYDLDFSNFDLIISGHIHEKLLTQIDDDTVFLQPGSLERCNVAEARDEENQGKGVYIIDTDNIDDAYAIANGFIPLKSNRKFIIADMYMKKNEDINNIENEICSYINNFDVPPVLFLSVHDVSNSFPALIDLTKDLKKKFLTVNFNYFDENTDFDVEIIGDANDIPTPREALKIALNPLDEEERALGLDLYDSLKDGKDVSEMLDNFFEDRRAKEVIDVTPYDDNELDDIIQWVNK